MKDQAEVAKLYRTLSRTALLLFAVLALGSCTSVTVTTEYDPTADFVGLRTYAWRAGQQRGTGDPRFDNALFDRRVHVAVDRVLGSKGYRMAAAGTAPDFIVGYHAVLRQRTSSRTINQWYGYRYGRGWHGIPGTQTYEYEYEEGTLLIDVIDPANTELLWRGSGTGVVDPKATSEQRERRINDAVERILADFPPGATAR